MTSFPTIIHKLEFVRVLFATIYAQCIQAILFSINCALDSNIHRLLKKLVVNKWCDPLLHKLVIAHVHIIPHQFFLGKGGERVLRVIGYNHGHNSGKGCHLCDRRAFYHQRGGTWKVIVSTTTTQGATLISCSCFVTDARHPLAFGRLRHFKPNRPNKTFLGGYGFPRTIKTHVDYIKKRPKP